MPSPSHTTQIINKKPGPSCCEKLDQDHGKWLTRAFTKQQKNKSSGFDYCLCIQVWCLAVYVDVFFCPGCSDAGATVQVSKDQGQIMCSNPEKNAAMSFQSFHRLTFSLGGCSFHLAWYNCDSVQNFPKNPKSKNISVLVWNMAKVHLCCITCSSMYIPYMSQLKNNALTLSTWDSFRRINSQKHW